jgi:predicted ribosome quality control (RQC) complex YloA/Tae2 family protein
MAKLYGIIIVLGLLGGLGFGAKYYYDSTQAKIEQLVAEKQILDQAVKTNEATIGRMRQDAERTQRLNDELQANLREAEAGLDQIRATLSDHDLTRLALRKPGLIETRINNGTKQVFEQIEVDSGATPPSNPTD